MCFHFFCHDKEPTVRVSSCAVNFGMFEMSYDEFIEIYRLSLITTLR